MFDRRQLIATGAAIVLMSASFGNAQADDPDEKLAGVRIDPGVASGIEIRSTYRADASATPDLGGSQPEVIDEIVVIGKKNRWVPNFRGSLSGDSLLPNPARIDLQFLPTFDPEQAYPYADQFLLGEELRRTGFIELFRIRFGR